MRFDVAAMRAAHGHARANVSVPCSLADSEGSRAPHPGIVSPCIGHGVGLNPIEGVFWLASVAAFLVGLSKGGLPAVGMLSVPVLSLVISPLRAAALLLPIYILTDAVGVWLYRREHSRDVLRALIPAGVLGVAVGWALAAFLSDRAVGFLIGLMGVLFCLNAWLRKAVPADGRKPSRLKAWVCGTASGFASFVSHAGGPPYQIYVLPQRLPKTVFAGTSTLFFAVINLAKLPPYHALNPYSMVDLHNMLALAPAAIAGTIVGAWVTRRIAERLFFRLVQMALFAVSLQLIWKSLVRA